MSECAHEEAGNFLGTGKTPEALAVHLAKLTETYQSDDGLDLVELLPALAVMVVDLVVVSAGDDPDRRREALLDLRMALDRLYPSSVWPDDTRLIDGRLAWAIRERIAIRLQELDVE